MTGTTEGSSSEARKGGFALKDYIGIVFSFCALVVSISSFYFTNLRIDNNAFIRMAGGDVDFIEKGDLFGYKSYVYLNLIVGNPGNRPVVISQAEIEEGTPEDDPHFQARLRPGNVVRSSTIAEMDGHQDPILLSPRDLKLIRFRVPIAAIFQDLEFGVAVEDRPGNVLIRERVSVTAIDCFGYTHNIKFGKLEFEIHDRFIYAYSLNSDPENHQVFRE